MANSKYSCELNDFFKEMSQLSEEQMYMKQLVDLRVSVLQKWLAHYRSVFENHVDNVIIKFMDDYMKSCIGFYEMDVYGSTVEGLNCYTQYDMGDIDVMLYPTAEEAMLNESMLEYVDGEPAFVRVRGKDNPLLQRCLYGETDFVATATLKGLDSTIFGGANMYVYGIPKVEMLSNIPFPNTETFSVSEALDNQDGPSFQLNMRSTCVEPKHPIPIGAIVKMFDVSRLPEDVRQFSSTFFLTDFQTMMDKLIQTVSNDYIHILTENPTYEELLKALSAEKSLDLLTKPLRTGLSTQLNDYEMPDMDQEDAQNYEALSTQAMNQIKKIASSSLSQSHTSWNVQKQENELQEKPLKSGMDMVPCFKVKGWPQVAEAWLLRDRKWPSAETISEIVNNGFHLVNKSPKHGKTSPDIDFRLSFSHAELLLSKELNDMQRECYRCFKLLYKALDQNTEPKIISTYLLKTTLLWTVEETGMEMWNENNRASCVMMLLERLHHSLETKFLPHYFIPEFNLLEEVVIEYPQQLQNLADEVREMCDRPKESYQQKANIADKASSSDEIKENQNSPSEMAKKSGTFQFKVMPKEEFEDLYFDVLAEIIAQWIVYDRYNCEVEDPTLQSIISFLHLKVLANRARALDSTSESSELCEELSASELLEIAFDLIKVIKDCLPDLELTYQQAHLAYNGQDPKESILSLFKLWIEMDEWLDLDEDNECRGDDNVPLPVLSEYFRKTTHNVLAASFGVANALCQSSKAPDDDDIPLD